MNIFEILGPVMVGPSSSHTAGAVRIGLMTRRLLAERPVKAVIGMHGSFAATGLGHGTDRGSGGRASWHAAGGYEDSRKL